MLEALKLDEIDISDKFLMMEELWDNMSQNASAHGFSPQWHFDILSQREEKIKAGELKFSAISDVRERLRKSINEN